MNTKNSKKILSTTAFAAIIVLFAFTVMCASVSAQPYPGIDIVKTASPTEGAPSTDVTFTITVNNIGDCTLDPVKVVDTLPAGMSYVTAGTSPAPSSVVGNTITWDNVGPLNSGDSTTITLVAHIDSGASGTLTDSVTATGTPPAGDDVTDTATADVTALAPGISVEKTASPTEGAPSTDVTFTITVNNIGDCTLDPVKVVDTLPAGMSYVTAGTSPAPSSVVGNTITWDNVGPLNSGDSTTITLVAHIDSGASGTLTDSVTATGTPPAGDDVTDTATADVTALAPGISVEKTASPTEGAPSTDVTFTITVNNIGDCTLDPVKVVDTLPAGMSYVTAGTSPAPSSVVGNTITWDNVGPLNSGDSTTITLVAHIDSGASGTLTDSVTATGTPPAGDDVTATGTADVKTLVPDIEVIKTAAPSEGIPCTDVTFTIKVKNTGDCTLDPVKVVDTLPAGMSYVSSSPAGSAVGDTITWANVGALASGASTTITLVAHIEEGATETLTNELTASGTPPAGDDVTDIATATVVRLDLWNEINDGLDDLIAKVNAADITPDPIKTLLVNKLKRAKAFKERAKIAYEAGDKGRAKKYLGKSKRQVESFEDRVQITDGISPADKESFLEDSATIKEKIDTLLPLTSTPNPTPESTPEPTPEPTPSPTPTPTPTPITNKPPVADPDGPYTGTEGALMTFAGSCSYDPDGSIVSYEWDFGDGATGTGVSPTHTYAQEGVYPVTLIVTDNDGATDTKSTTAAVDDTEPVAGFTAIPTSGYEPLSVDFTGTSTSYDGITAWEWDFGDGESSSDRNPTHVYDEDGSFTVMLTVSESDGDSDTERKPNYISVIDPWNEINEELDDLIAKVNAADITPNPTKTRLVNNLKRAKAFKERAKEAHEAGDNGRAKKYLGKSKNQVESFEDRVQITGGISQADKNSFLAKSSSIKAKIDNLIGKL